MTELLLFMKKAGLSPHSSLFTVTEALDMAGEDELLDDVTEAMDEFGLKESHRVSSLLNALEEDDDDSQYTNDEDYQDE